MKRRAAFDEAEYKIHRPSDSAGTLWEQPTTGIAFQAPSNPTDTSQNAADDLTFTASGRARREAQLMRILRLICSRESGFTIDEIDAATMLGTGSICARICDLRIAGYIDTSSTITRRTRRGKSAAVHFATLVGRRRVAEAA